MCSEKHGFVVGTIGETPKLVASLIELEEHGFGVQDIGVIASLHTMQSLARQLRRRDDVQQLSDSLLNDTVPLRRVENTVALVGSRDSCLKLLAESNADSKHSTRSAIVDELNKAYWEIAISIDDKELILFVAVNNVSQLVLAAEVVLRHSVQSIQTHLISTSDVNKVDVYNK